jgi:transcriptional regulator with XRE-family HTH domain
MAHGQAAQIDGSKILTWRLEKGWTQGDVAINCAAYGQTVSDSQLSRIERGVHHPRPALLRALASVFGVDVKDLTVTLDNAA